jgi:hypothetical protein
MILHRDFKTDKTVDNPVLHGIQLDPRRLDLFLARIWSEGPELR